MSDPQLRDPGCKACQSLTSGDCGMHGPRSIPYHESLQHEGAALREENARLKESLWLQRVAHGELCDAIMDGKYDLEPHDYIVQQAESLRAQLRTAQQERDHLRGGFDQLMAAYTFDKEQFNKAEARATAAEARLTWQPIATAPKDGTAVLLRIPLDNGSKPRMATVCGFFAAAGTMDMDCDDETLVSEDGSNAEDAWFSQSEDREPWAMMLNYEPTEWAVLPSPPAEETT